MSDIEKQDLGVKGADVERTTSTAEGNVEEIKRAREIQSSNVVLRKLKQGEAWMDEKMGVETQGIDRVLEENKDPPSILNVIKSFPSTLLIANIHADLLALVVSQCSCRSCSTWHTRT